MHAYAFSNFPAFLPTHTLWLLNLLLVVPTECSFLSEYGYFYPVLMTTVIQQHHSSFDNPFHVPEFGLFQYVLALKITQLHLCSPDKGCSFTWFALLSYARTVNGTKLGILTSGKTECSPCFVSNLSRSFNGNYVVQTIPSETIPKVKIYQPEPWSLWKSLLSSQSRRLPEYPSWSCISWGQWRGMLWVLGKYAKDFLTKSIFTPRPSESSTCSPFYASM